MVTNIILIVLITLFLSYCTENNHEKKTILITPNDTELFILDLDNDFFLLLEDDSIIYTGYDTNIVLNTILKNSDDFIFISNNYKYYYNLNKDSARTVLYNIIKN